MHISRPSATLITLNALIRIRVFDTYLFLCIILGKHKLSGLLLRGAACCRPCYYILFDLTRKGLPPIRSTQELFPFLSIIKLLLLFFSLSLFSYRFATPTTFLIETRFGAPLYCHGSNFISPNNKQVRFQIATVFRHVSFQYVTCHPSRA
jgi:hypothetical protein